VTGKATVQTGDTVTKYGFASHFTTGIATVLQGGRFDFNIRSSTLPSFADGDPQTVTPQGGGAVQVSPRNDAFFNAWVKNSVVRAIIGIDNPQQATTIPAADATKTCTQDSDCSTMNCDLIKKKCKGRRYDGLEAYAIFNDCLWKNGLVMGSFGSPGDSGSFVMKGSQVIGLLTAATWMEDADPNGLDCQGRKWGKFWSTAYAFDISSAIDFVNKEALATGVQLPTLAICQEAGRPK